MTRIEFLMKSLIEFHQKHQRFPDEWRMHPVFFNECVRECGDYVKARHEPNHIGVHHFEMLGIPVNKDATVHSVVAALTPPPEAIDAAIAARGKK